MNFAISVRLNDGSGTAFDNFSLTRIDIARFHAKLVDTSFWG